MRQTIEASSLKTGLIAFAARNNLRPTRLEVLGPTKEVESDFWLEDGLLLEGIDVDTDDDRDVSVEIMLQGRTGEGRNHMTHTVAGVKKVNLETRDVRDEGLEIEDTKGAVTILRFEST